jgi:hypothetical protein
VKAKKANQPVNKNDDCHDLQKQFSAARSGMPDQG